MAVRRVNPTFVYGMGDNLIQMPPRPIVAERDPSTSDLAELGTLWINKTSGTIFGLADITAGSANWASTPAAGATTLTSLDITGVGGLDVQNAGSTTTISSSTINLDNATGLTTISGDLTVAGTFTMNGDLDLSSAALIDLTSTLDADPSIYLHANGGTSEVIRFRADQGTAVNSIDLVSDVGGITLTAGLASDDGINLNATAGGVDIDGALQVNIASSENAADAIIINSSAGGLDITAAGAAGEDIDIVNTAGSININSGEVIADSMVLTSAGGLDFTVAGTGGLDIDMANAAGSINITASEAAADAIVIHADDATGGIQLQAGSNGILIGNQADCAVIDLGDIVPTSARTITLAGGTVATAIADTLDLAPDGVDTDAGASKVVTINNGGVTLGTLTTNVASGAITSGTHTVNIQTGNAAGGTVAANISTGTGTKTVNLGNADANTTLNIDAVTLINDSVNANLSLNTGTSTGTVSIGNSAAGAITVDTAAGISLDSATASNFTVTGAADLTLDSTAGSVNIDGGEAVADAIVLNASDAAGGIQLQAGSNGILIGNQADCAVIDLGDIVPTSARTITVGGGAVATAIADTIDIAPDGATTDAGASKVLNLNTGALDTATLTTNIASGNVTSGTHATNVSTGTGTKTVNVGNADANTTVNVDATTLINDSINANTSINTGTSTGTVTVGSSNAGAIDIDSGAAITVDTTAGISLDGATASNFTVTGASADLTLSSSGGSVNVTATEAAADAIVLNASNASGGIDLLTGGGEVSISSSGNVTMAPGTATEASPTATATINARVFKATFTGFTTASGSSQDFTITNSAFTAGDGVMVTVSNAGSNDAKMSLERVDGETTGTLVISTQNNGAAALNGNVVITGWIID